MSKRAMPRGDRLGQNREGTQVYDHILVPVAIDHEADTDGAIGVARRLLNEGGKITALTVLEPVPGFVANEIPADVLQNTTHHMHDALKDAVHHAQDIATVVATGHPGRGIIDYAEANGVDCIVIASHTPGLADYFLGGTAARVVRHAPCAVHVLR